MSTLIADGVMILRAIIISVTYNLIGIDKNKKYNQSVFLKNYCIEK